jgi:hypothetical protein
VLDPLCLSFDLRILITHDVFKVFFLHGFAACQSLKVDLYSGCDSDATSNAIVAMEKQYFCEIIAFVSRRYYRF